MTITPNCNDKRQKIQNLRAELNALPKKGRLDLGGKGIGILNKINRLEAEMSEE